MNQLAASVREDWIKQYAGKFDSKTLFDYAESLFNQ